MRVETVKIIDEKHPYGHKIINKSDMKEGDKEYIEDKPKAKPKKNKKKDGK